MVTPNEENYTDCPFPPFYLENKKIKKSVVRKSLAKKEPLIEIATRKIL
jgi:hypothetical protein